MKHLLKGVVFAMAMFVANVLHAQLQLSSADLAAIESTPPLPATELPAYGNFYSSANPGYPTFLDSRAGIWATVIICSTI